MFGRPIPNPANLTPNQQALQMFGASAGKGLTAVGNMRPGTSAAGALAAGAGGALTGGTAYTEAQQQQARQQKLDSYNMSSNYFKDILAAKQQEDTAAYRKMLGDLAGARADSIKAGGTANGRPPAYQNSPYWQTMKIEDGVRQEEKNQQILMQKRWQIQ